MRQVAVDLGARSYAIHIGPVGLEGLHQAIEQALGSRRLAVVTDCNVAPLWADAFVASVRAAGAAAELFVMDVGESAKTIRTVASVWAFLSEHTFDRRTTAVVALGGGVVGDIAGFAASSWLRGVDYVQVPTTLLAQVDSSVGGKTGFNFGGAKNMVGAFYQPRLVWAGLQTLTTLEPREVRAGLAEVIKHGLLGRPEIIDFVRANRAAFDVGPLSQKSDLAVLEPLVAMCCEVKRDVVQQDEREGGVRAILNLGHTFGHAIEAHTDHALRHGEAVALGLVSACRVSEALGLCGPEVRAEVVDVLQCAGLDTDDTPYWNASVAERIWKDKKVTGQTVRFVALRSIGQVELVDVAVDELKTIVGK